MSKENKLKSQMCEIPEEFKMLEANYLKLDSIVLNQATMILICIEAIRMYVVHCLSENLLKKGYMNNLICLCIFIKKKKKRNRAYNNYSICG